MPLRFVQPSTYGSRENASADKFFDHGDIVKLRTNRTVLQGLTLVASFAAIGGAIAAPCIGPGAPTTGETRCLTAIAIPGNPLRSYDISWVNPERGEYYLADRSNAGIDIINTKNNTFVKTIKGFVGVKLYPSMGFRPIRNFQIDKLPAWVKDKKRAWLSGGREDR